MVINKMADNIIITENIATKYVINGINQEINRIQSTHRYIEYNNHERLKLQKIYKELKTL